MAHDQMRVDGNPLGIILVSKEYPPSPRSYGIGTYVWEAAKAFSGAGHHVTVLAASDDAVSEQDKLDGGIRVIRIPDVERYVPGPLTWKGLRSSRSLGIVYSAKAFHKARKFGIAYRTAVAQRVEKLIDGGYADIVEFPAYRGESFVWAAMPRRIPMVTRVHGRAGWIHRDWRDLFEPCRRLMNLWESKELMIADAASAVAAHMVPKIVQRVSPSRVCTIYNGLDPLFWSTSREREARLTDKDILFVGSHVRAKGVFLLIETASALRNSTNWRGDLVLAGRNGTEFENYVRDRGGSLPGWIRVLGHCQRDTLASLYTTAGVCCLPSFNEGFNYTGLEALASGAILVGSSAGMAEMITADAGFLVPPGNRQALGKALHTALSLDESSRRTMRLNAQQAVRDRFDSRKIAVQMTDWYRTIIQGFHSTPLGKQTRYQSTNGSAEH